MRAEIVLPGEEKGRAAPALLALCPAPAAPTGLTGSTGSCTGRRSGGSGALW